MSTSDVVDWFEKLNHKSSKKFIKFDVVSFYPSITEELLKNAIQWGRKFTEVSEKEENIIIDSKKSVLFNKKIAWVKREAQIFMSHKAVMTAPNAQNLLDFSYWNKFQKLTSWRRAYTGMMAWG